MRSNLVSNRESDANKPFRVRGLIRGSVMWHVLGRKWPLNRSQSTSLLRTLGKCFPQCYTRFRGVGSLLQLRRWHTLSSARVTSVHGVELQPTAWYQVCSTVPTGLLGRMLQFPSSEGLGRETDGLVPVAPTCFSLIIIDVDQFKPKSTQRSVKSERARTQPIST
jgi:hypothetical protein